ncbi:MAG TPA: type II toxin-antitoxin system VapC family toxin [Arachnia sp.]|nr:type II toxin-antitoxin system VapC family toxin [Arachnia sp.]HMT86926.1 type II toxin-antitoxin system VapC family toxin [Arachnia sp.]
MILDTSAAVAMLRGEPEAEEFREIVEHARTVRMSAASVLELAMVIGRGDPGLVDAFVQELGIDVVPVDAEHLRWARIAFERFGRGSGSPARLNYGDCLSYGAARALGEPLLFKGEDFVHTDVAVGSS